MTISQKIGFLRKLYNILILMNNKRFDIFSQPTIKNPFFLFKKPQIPDLYYLIYDTNINSNELFYFNNIHSSKRRVLPQESLRVNWIIPDIGYGSGGHMTVMRFVNYLSKIGIINRVYVFPRSVLRSHAELKQFIESNYINCNTTMFYCNCDQVEDSDITIATSWQTAYRVFNIKNTFFKYYLIQDFEPFFYPVGSLFHFAQNTYLMNYYGICASNWLKNTVFEKYHMPSFSFNLGYDSNIYYINNNIERNPDNICVYIRPRTERRGLELLIGALKIIKQQRKQTNIYLFGSDDLYYSHLPFEFELLGQLKQNDLCTLYNTSSICLLTSLTNYSLIPIEAMSCGCLVLDVNVESTRGAFSSDDPIVLCPPNPHAIAETAIRYLDNNDERDNVTNKALSFVKQYEWENIFNRFQTSFIESYLGRCLDKTIHYPNGTVVKAIGLEQYYIIENGNKRAVTNINMINNLIIDNHDIQQVHPNILLSIPNGELYI